MSGGDFLLWKSEFAEQCQNTSEINQAHCCETAQQLDFDPAVYDPVNVAAKKAWDELHRGRLRIDLKLGRVQAELVRDFCGQVATDSKQSYWGY